MNRKEASFILANIDRRVCDDELNEALDMAIKALEQQPCGNAIDRKLVCAFIDGLISDDGERGKGLDYIRSMPPANPTKTGWIPVSERLPKENEEVLVTTEWGEVTIGKRYSTIDYFINDGAINANEDEIVAWMPLPKPYEPQERSGQFSQGLVKISQGFSQGKRG